MIKNISLFLILLLTLTIVVGCSKKRVDSEINLITKEDAYNIYYNTIKKFVPELMTEPQECDVDIKTRDEVTFLTEHFVRNTTVKIQSQNAQGKLQYYLLNKFPEADKMDFYCIDNDKFYNISCELNGKGELKERNSSYIRSFLFPYLNTPLFKQDAIKSFDSKKNGSDLEIIFVIDGSDMEYGYPQRVMKEINPTPDNNLDDVKIILNVDKNNIPKTMSTKISMSLFNNNGELYAKKALNMDFTFNKPDKAEFNLQNVISQYASDASSIK